MKSEREQFEEWALSEFGLCGNRSGERYVTLSGHEEYLLNSMRSAWQEARRTAPREAAPDFPVMYSKGDKAGPLKISWATAERAYSVYSSRYGMSQSILRLKERGGFGAGELDDFIPGWRDEAIAKAEAVAPAEPEPRAPTAWIELGSFAPLDGRYSWAVFLHAGGDAGVVGIVRQESKERAKVVADAWAAALNLTVRSAP